jgi:hypothetical protein
MLSVEPVNYDWSGGYGERWETREYKAADSDEKPEDWDDEIDGEYTGVVIDEEASGPMMNYYYPLPEFRGDETTSQKALYDLPLCLVHFTEEEQDRGAPEYALALTGGGMDLSWEICEAFMRLGYLPPVHFAESIPEMCGRGDSPRDKWILAGCRRSLQGQKDRAGRALRRLRERFGNVKG